MNLEELVAFHKNHGKLVTVTAVRPGARFGELQLDNLQVTSFRKAPAWTRLDQRGLLRHRTGIFDLIAGDSTIWSASRWSRQPEWES